MTNSTPSDFDIVIAGGGMIGSTLALALGPLGLSVAVVEPVPRAAAMQPSFDDRSTALSRSSQRMFAAMGLWQAVASTATPIHQIHVSERGRFGFSHIDAAQQKVDALGYVVINRVLGEVLHKALDRQQGLNWICPARITAVTLSDDQAEVTVDGEHGVQRLTCRLLVAADGANSSVRNMVGIDAKRTDYEQTAVIGNLEPEKKPRNTAYERFLDDGTIAMLPVEGGRVAFVWMMPPNTAGDTLELSDREFIARLQDLFGQRLGTFSKAGKRAAYPLALSKAESLIAKRCVVVGNAAHGLHPVAAQGFNLGMRDIAALCDCIFDANARGETDPGALRTLEEYAEWRAPDQRKLVRFTDGLVKLFRASRPPLRTMRNIGMLGFDLVPGVRSLFARHTMGLAGRLPRLSRGVPLE